MWSFDRFHPVASLLPACVRWKVEAKTDAITLDLETIASTATGSFDGALSSDGDMKSSDGLTFGMDWDI
jgi:hypothetical protein